MNTFARCETCRWWSKLPAWRNMPTTGECRGTPPQQVAGATPNAVRYPQTDGDDYCSLHTPSATRPESPDSMPVFTNAKDAARHWYQLAMTAEHDLAQYRAVAATLTTWLQGYRFTTEVPDTVTLKTSAPVAVMDALTALRALHKETA